MNNAELARRVIIRTLADNTQTVVVTDTDPNDQSDDPAKVSATPTGLATKILADIGLLNPQQVEVFRADLRSRLPLIDGELLQVKLSAGTKIGLLRDFIAAALDLKS